MDLGEAKSIVQNMKAKYAAYARLEEAISSVEQEMGLLNEKRERSAKLDLEIDGKQRALNEVVGALAEAKEKVRVMEDTYAKQFHTLEEDFQNKRRSIANDLKNDEDAAEQRRAVIKDEMETLATDKAGLQENIAALQAQLKAIRESIRA